ncbi:MAG: hypothetical protein M3416_03410 [Acidobacteriota bacterium]|nr:hypothetical protein [Acidobacteriota bacterium]
MNFRRHLPKVGIGLLLAGLAAAGFFYVSRREPVDKRLTRAIYQNWLADHGEIIREHGAPREVRFVSIHFQVFSTGYVTYNVTAPPEAVLFFAKDKMFRRVPKPSAELTLPPHRVNEELLRALLDGVPPGDRDQYEALFWERVRHGRVGVVGGIAILYMQEQLLRDFGRPLFNEKRFDNVLYAKGDNYDLIVGLPIGDEGPFPAGDLTSPRKVFILYKDGRFEDTTEFPANYARPFGLPPALSEFYRKYHQSAWFWPLTVLGGFLVTYALGMGALLLLAWRRGSIIFSRTFLISVAAKPLLVAPALGRRILFLGYRKRAARLRDVRRASEDYYGLPAEDSGGLIPLDPRGESLHARIAAALGPQQPVLLVGKGGAGKSTVLARLTHLAVEGRLPPPLKGLVPVLVPASYYSTSLVRAVADTLRARDGVAVDEQIVKGQLQSGGFLILFDGVSEVITPTQESLEEILRTARHADYRGCRFIVSTRPLDPAPADAAAIQLHPLTLDVVSYLLEHSSLHAARRHRVLRQLRHFGQKPIAPLLFSMVVEAQEDQQASSTRSQIYERYFRELLRAGKDDNLWSGWQRALETLALHTLIETGRRGVGLPHERLMNLIGERQVDGQTVESLSKRLYRLYHLPVKDELDLLNQLLAAGLLQRGRRWRFAHDTFEEFFAASHIVSYFDSNEAWPPLDEWRGSQELEQAFTEVLEFVREMMDEHSKARAASANLPERWRDCLAESPGGEAQPQV